MKLLSLTGLVLLTACSTVQPPRLSIPHELLEDCRVGSELKVGTNGELSESLMKLANTLKLCNIDKQKLREWAKE